LRSKCLVGAIQKFPGFSRKEFFRSLAAVRFAGQASLGQKASLGQNGTAVQIAQVDSKDHLIN
jgi:hypothetical protein